MTETETSTETAIREVANLKERAIRGASARIFAQASGFVLRIVSLAALARLLAPKDFGLVGMVTAFTGVLSLFRDFGLSAASVQRKTVTNEQTSTLFWINVMVGAALASVSCLLAPVVASFYHEPRLYLITSIVGAGFLFNATGIQHSALLQRQMRFTVLSLIDIVSLLVGTVVAIGMARTGYGYWALVVMTVAVPLTATVGFWMATGWIPGWPRRQSGIRSMMRFGSTLTLTGLIVYIASNFEKVLLGRFWGAESIGIYGRAYQLSRIPTDNFNSAVGEVAFSALSRLQDQPARLRRYFLKGYSLVLALTLPATLACCLFADDTISVLLGPQWRDAAPIFRLLAPTILVFAIANPLAWLLSALGMVDRLLKMSSVIAPILIAGYLFCIPYGPKGVAVGYSVVMTLWIGPLILWSLHGTVIPYRDVLITLMRPLASGVLAAGAGWAVRSACSVAPLYRLILECGVMLAVYLWMLLYVMGQKAFYVDLLRRLIGCSVVEENESAPL